MDITKQPFVTEVVETKIGPVPLIATIMSAVDRLGTAKVRLGFGRMGYTVEPGLYGVGRPDSDSPVLVTANYKLSFDHLRCALLGVDAWVLVLDTFGINVWCAAGKGSFGTTELVGRIGASRLAELVNPRIVVVPQLGAPGIAAHLVKKQSGFKVNYGPVMARDLPAFIGNNLQATSEMRRKDFPLRERLALIPLEITMAGKWLLGVLAAVFCLSGLAGAGPFFEEGVRNGAGPIFYLLAGVVAGGGGTPILLPWLPGRAFAVKGAVAGILAGIIVAGVRWLLAGVVVGPPDVAWFLIATAVASILGMNFTGASTYTSLSGVEKEMRLAVPGQIICIAAGSLWWLGYIFIG